MRSKIQLVVFLLLVASLTVWWQLGTPQSWMEAKVTYRLLTLSPSDAKDLDITQLVEGDWTLVCDSHGYGGPQKIERFGRTYPAIGDAQDGAWGLLFIRADGSYFGVRGNCRVPGFGFELQRCLDRTDAIVRRSICR
jgi:hypothetical protein